MTLPEEFSRLWVEALTHCLEILGGNVSFQTQQFSAASVPPAFDRPILVVVVALSEMALCVFWTVRDTELSDAQRERVIQYWQRCVAWSQGLPKPPARLLSALSTLSRYVSTADGREKELLEAVAPYIYDGYNSDEFFAELLRLVNVSPDGVSAILGKAIESRVPSFDFEDRLKSLLRQLAGKGRKQDAILYAERLRALGMQELFDELTGSE